METEDSQNADKIIGDCTLLLGDCLERMKQIPGKSIDAIICDLPYGTTACKWDTVIPFEPLWAQYKRIIKDRGAIALFGSEPFSSYLRMSNIKEYKYDWIWEKERPTNIYNMRYEAARVHEVISVFHGSNYFPIMGDAIQPWNNNKAKNKSQSGNMNEIQTIQCRAKISNYYNPLTRYPRSVLKMSRGTRKNKNLHPTQKPVLLLEYLVKTYTLENETILDNCMGSGTTGVACINTSRKFIGIEKERNYFDISVDRINKAYSEKSSELFQ